MRMLIVTLSAALMSLSIVPQAGAAKSHLKCGGTTCNAATWRRCAIRRTANAAAFPTAPITEACCRQYLFDLDPPLHRHKQS